METYAQHFVHYVMELLRARDLPDLFALNVFFLGGMRVQMVGRLRTTYKGFSVYRVRHMEQNGFTMVVFVDDQVAVDVGLGTHYSWWHPHEETRVDPLLPMEARFTRFSQTTQALVYGNELARMFGIYTDDELSIDGERCVIQGRNTQRHEGFVVTETRGGGGFCFVNDHQGFWVESPTQLREWSFAPSEEEGDTETEEEEESPTPKRSRIVLSEDEDEEEDKFHTPPPEAEESTNPWETMTYKEKKVYDAKREIVPCTEDPDDGLWCSQCNHHHAPDNFSAAMRKKEDFVRKCLRYSSTSDFGRGCVRA